MSCCPCSSVGWGERSEPQRVLQMLMSEFAGSLQPTALPWGESGAYVSRRSALSPADRQRALEMLERIGRSGAAWRAFQRYYPEANLGESVRSR